LHCRFQKLVDKEPFGAGSELQVAEGRDCDIEAFEYRCGPQMASGLRASE